MNHKIPIPPYMEISFPYLAESRRIESSRRGEGADAEGPVQKEKNSPYALSSCIENCGKDALKIEHV